MSEWRKYTKDEIISLGEKNNNLRYQSLIKKKFGEEYLNPLFIGCCVKFEEVIKRMEDVNGYNGAAYFYYGLGPWPRYTYPNRSEMDFYKNVVEKDYLDLTFVNKVKEISDEELVKLIKEKRQHVEIKKPQATAAAKNETIVKSTYEDGVLTINKNDVRSLGIEKINRYKSWFPNTKKELDPLFEGSKVVYGYINKYCKKVSKINKKNAQRLNRSKYVKYTPSVKPKDIYNNIVTKGFFRYKVDVRTTKYNHETFDSFYDDMEMGIFDDD